MMPYFVIPAEKRTFRRCLLDHPYSKIKLNVLETFKVLQDLFKLRLGDLVFECPFKRAF